MEAVSKHSLGCEEETWFDGDSTVMKRSTNGRVGWVRRNAGLITESAHPREKCEPGSRDASIYRLPCLQVKALRFISDSSPTAVIGRVYG
jgi:hypothetical protein